MEERLWCLACGTVTRDQRCDCNRYGADHEMYRKPNFVNFADEMRKTAVEQAAQIDALVSALEDSRSFMVEMRKRHGDSGVGILIKAADDALALTLPERGSQ